MSTASSRGDARKGAGIEATAGDGTPALTLVDLYPTAGSTRPGAGAELELLVHNGGAPVEASVRAQLLDNGVQVARSDSAVSLAHGTQAVRLTVSTPPGRVAGYRARVDLLAGTQAVEGHTAVLAVNHWSEAPRYGFLSEFGPEGAAEDGAIRKMARYGLTVVQFYDWMYRHYRFLPPEDEFTDAMGRTLSLAAVRRRVRQCHEHGIWALAYGAVYGAEAEFVADRPDLVLFDAEGQALSLIERFFINDLRPSAGWRDHILAEFESAVTAVGFDGIHMDQYGFPKWGYDHRGEPVDLAVEFGPMIDEAARRLSLLKADAAVLFNAVNAWPLAEVAGRNQGAVYIEVWPPFVRYRHLVELIRRARTAGGKHAILAAYLEPFRSGGPGAEQSALIATAVIAGAGGFHLLLGEGDMVLRDPYYPNHGGLDESFVPTMRRYYEHTAALHDYLYPFDLSDVGDTFAGGVNGEVMLEGTEWSVEPEAGKVWLAIRRRNDGARRQLVVNLVNLRGLTDDLWNSPKESPAPASGIVLRLSRHFRVVRATCSTPDDGGDWREVVPSEFADGTGLALPDLRLWHTLIVDLA